MGKKDDDNNDDELSKDMWTREELMSGEFSSAKLFAAAQLRFSPMKAYLFKKTDEEKAEEEEEEAKRRLGEKL